MACDQPFAEVERPELRRVFQYIHGGVPLDIPSGHTMQRRIQALGSEAIEEVRKMIRVPPYCMLSYYTVNICTREF